MEDNNFNKTELFENCYCQKVLPLAYDNSLSYYEVLCKLTGKINELIDIINETDNTISEETAQRSEADTQLQNNINTEKTARENADAQLQTNIDTLSNDTFHKNQVVPIANGGTGANNEQQAIVNLAKNTIAIHNKETEPFEDRSTGNFRITINGYLGLIYITNTLTFNIKPNDNGYILFQTLDTKTNITTKRYRPGNIKSSDGNAFYIEYEIANGILKIYIYTYMQTENKTVTFRPQDNFTFPLIIY